MKTFTEMSTEERGRWLRSQNKNGNIKLRDGQVIDRVKNALFEFGPMTTPELARKVGYSKPSSLNAWANKSKPKLVEYGIIRHPIPEDGKTLAWMLKMHLKPEPAKDVEEEIEAKRVPTLLDRMSGVGDA